MPFSLENTWTACEGATKCPCPNHFPPTLRLESVFRDPIDDDHLAIGNYCSTSDDEDIIGRSIPTLRAQIQTTEVASQKLTQLRNALRLELDKVEGGLDRLREHHGTLSLALRRRGRIMAPITRLPSEILTEILWITSLLWFSDEPQAITMDDDDELQAFQLVCQRWRRVVLQSPKLWSRICIYPRGSHFQTVNSREGWSLTRRIDHSARAELDVRICSFGERPLPPLLVTLLEQICSRIRSLSLSLSPSEILSLSPLRDSFNLLRYLDVGDDELFDSNLPPMKLFDKAPKLVVYSTLDLANGDWLGIPWSQIIRHSHGYARIHAVLEALEAANNLQDGTFTMSYGSLEPLRVGLDPIVCTRLTYLTVYMPDGDEVDQNAHPLRQLFQQCSFPALVRLFVSTGGDVPPDFEHDTIETFHALLLCLQRSRSPLSVLSYNHAPLAPADVDAFFRSAPTISHVEFTCVSSGLSDAAFQSLHVQPGQVDICAPRLESVLLHGELEFDVVNFATMVKSRRDVTPLCSVDLHWHIVTGGPNWGDVDPVKTRRWTSEGAILADGLKGYAERGMDLGICTKTPRCGVLLKSRAYYPM